MTPRYYSTRDQSRQRVPFQEALLKGLAPDGGLYLPDAVPTLEPETYLGTKGFPELAKRVLERWLQDEVTEDALKPLAQDAFNFPVPLVPLGDDLYVLELFHGPTLSFKDFGARTMARLMSHFLKARKEKLTILVATSGDTGSAVADGFSGQENISVVLLYPQGKVSPVQERQLIVKRPGVRALAVEGSFDDCQNLVKAAFADEALEVLPLSSANSINIGRLLPQSLYYLWAARELSAHYQMAPLNFCVPSGNLGNLTGGVLAMLMGLRVNRFLAAHNRNDFFPRYLTGLREGFKPSVATLSNAMDVGAPSNFERLAALLTDEEMLGLLWGHSVSDEVTKTRMRTTYEKTGYVADPHTAVGLEAATRYRDETGDPSPVIVLATAHPAKFPETVSETLGVPPPKVDRLEALWQAPTGVTPLAPTLEALREALLSI